MLMSHKLVSIAKDLLTIELDLPFRFDYSTKAQFDEHPTTDDFELHLFPQVWGSTALGFGGIGGQAMTEAMTYVFIPENVRQNCFVYFGSRFAYSCPYSDTFMIDVKNRNMASVSRSGKYNLKSKNKSTDE